MVVYIIKNEAGYVKIGHADDARGRLRALQTANPGELFLIRVVAGGQKIERWFHRRFADQRVGGEWFHFVPEMLTVIAPDEIPVLRPALGTPRQSIGEFIREADKLGLLSESMRRGYAPFLEGKDG